MEQDTSLDWKDMLWIEPICDEKCNVSVDPFNLTLDQLEKINEYRRIRLSYESLIHKHATTE